MKSQIASKTDSLTLGYSTCPNDTFIFHALAHGLVDCGGVTFRTVLKDVEALNRDARDRRLEISKLSYAAIGQVLDSYALLRSGGALGRGCGPLIVARADFDPNQLKSVPIAVPGLWTTAVLLLNLFLKTPYRLVPMRFDKIMPLINEGRYAAGVIIHEGRFTYPEYGLKCIVDLGKWWEEETGLPIPLGGIAIRRDIPIEIAKNVEKSIAESVAHALENPGAADAYIQRHAAELSPLVIQEHIRLYVNDFTLDLGEQGKAAIEKLFAMAEKSGAISPIKVPILLD